MRRRAGILQPFTDRWFARRDPAGIWIITDSQGHQPLRALDPVERLYNVHLAAASPVLHHELVRLTTRFRHVTSLAGVEDYDWNWRYINAALQAIMEARPLYADVLTQTPTAAQLEMLLGEAA